MKLRLVLAGTALLCLGFTVQGGKVVWTFLHSPYSSNYDTAGIPKVTDKKLPPDQELLNRISAALPERVDIRTNHPELISDDVRSNVRLKAAADVYVTFLHADEWWDI